MPRALTAAFVAVSAMLAAVSRTVRRLRPWRPHDQRPHRHPHEQHPAPVAPPADRRPVLGAGAALACAAGTAAAAAWAVVYLRGGQVQLEGALLAVACAGPAVALGVAGRRLTDRSTIREERPEPFDHERERAELARELAAMGPLLGRRRLLTVLFGTSIAGLAAVALLPLRSLGPAPLDALRRTGWRAGRRLVDEQGRPLRLTDLPVGAMTTAFPEGATQHERADSQTVLVRVRPDELRLPADRRAAAPQGCIAFSKVCTHAGCSIGLYQVETRQLLCPCHQSVFDVTRGAKPVFGPATRSLPQLPLQVDGDGYLSAVGDFGAPVGPGFWSMGR